MDNDKKKTKNSGILQGFGSKIKGFGSWFKGLPVRIKGFGPWAGR